MIADLGSVDPEMSQWHVKDSNCAQNISHLGMRFGNFADLFSSLVLF